MPKKTLYEIHTTEAWYHNVTYLVEAESPELAVEMVHQGIGSGEDYVEEEYDQYGEDAIVSVNSVEPANTAKWKLTDTGWQRSL